MQIFYFTSLFSVPTVSHDEPHSSISDCIFNHVLYNPLSAMCPRRLNSGEIYFYKCTHTHSDRVNFFAKPLTDQLHSFTINVKHKAAKFNYFRG